ncbi:cation:proton antiporter domain-containing protein [Nocardioides montaniterrae]
MEIGLLLVALAATVLAVTAVSERYDAPAPLVLIVVGIAGSYLPGVPTLHLEPDVVLLGLLPPLLYAAALNTSLVDFNANRRSILLLSVGLVAASTVTVAAVVRLVLPDIHWPLAFAIGAVVAPPDAVAATAIGRRIGLPRRVVTILEGESLFNDATALTGLRAAIVAISGSVSAVHIGLDFVLAAGGGAVIGVATFVVTAFIRKHLTDPLLDTALSFVVPFAAYIAAERIEASGVVAVVVAGLLLGHKAPILQTAQSRVAERVNWRTIAFVLEHTVFLLIGLQAKGLVDEVRRSSTPLAQILAVCAAVLVTVVVVRMAWVFAARYLLIRPGQDPTTGHTPSWRYTFLLGWAGMRGVVTLAAAFVVPADTPHREILLLAAFTVVAGTLLGQGLTLPLVARRLHVPGPDPMDDALARATLLQQAGKAGFCKLDELVAEEEGEDAHGVRDVIVQRIEQRNFAAWERLGTTAGVESPSDRYSRWRTAMIEAERARVLEVRSTGSVPSEVVAEVLAMLDLEESMLDAADAERAEIRAAGVRVQRDGCDHIASTPLQDPPAELVCGPCLEAGSPWVALRMCLTCGAVGCCDSSPLRHATAHFHETTHPVMRSIEPGEDWRWCYVHHVTA